MTDSGKAIIDDCDAFRFSGPSFPVISFQTGRAHPCAGGMCVSSNRLPLPSFHVVRTCERTPLSVSNLVCVTDYCKTVFVNFPWRDKSN